MCFLQKVIYVCWQNHNNYKVSQMQHIHVNKLPSSKYFAATDVKQFLPFHQQTSIDNLKIILNNYALSVYPKNIILIPDQNLSIDMQTNISYYTYLKAIWCEDFDKQSELLKNSIAFASNLLNYFTTIDEDSPVDQMEKSVEGFVNRVSIVTIVNGEKIQFRNRKYGNLRQEKTSIGFKFEKYNNRMYMLIGVNIKTRESLALSCAVLRQWNLRRLKVKSTNMFDIDLIHRICQHLYCLARGFIRQVNSDYNTFHANLENLLKSLEGQQMQQQKLLCKKFQQFKLISGSIPHQATIIKCSVTFRKQITQEDTWELISQFVTQWLLQTPLTAGCSYASYVYYDQNQTLNLLIASHYQSSQKNKYGNETDLLKGCQKIQHLLYDETFKKPQSAQQNSIKNSMQLMNKYQAPPSERSQKNEPALIRQQTPPEISSSLNQSMNSQPSNQSKKANMKNIAKLQNNIYEILKILESKKKILSPPEMQNIIKQYLKILKERNPTAGLNQAQYEAIETFYIINEQLTADQVYLIIRNNFNQSGLTIPFILEKGRYNRAVAIGKMIGADHLENLFRQSLKTGFLVSRHTIIPYYLKKMAQVYCEPVLPQPLKIDQISIPQLVQIIQKKSYNNHFYTSILTMLVPQLFGPFTPIIKVLSPLLSHYAEHLMKLDHHHELVMSFMGQLIYQVCYYTNQAKINLLTNAVYMQDKYTKMLTIKQKKIIQMIREGGFKGFGFQIKSHIFPTIDSNKAYTQPPQLIYHIIRIEKPTQLLQFYKLLSTCHYTANINKIAKYLEQKYCYGNALNRGQSMCAYFIIKSGGRSQSRDWAVREELPGEEKKEGGVDEGQFDSLAQRILRSQSGIFQDMVRLNPNVKIAGIELKSAIKTLATSRISQKPVPATEPPKKGIVSQQQVLKHWLKPQLTQDYEYVQLALSSKQRYLNYHTLSQIEKSYFRDCATIVVDHRENIQKYVALSQTIKKVREDTK